MATLARSIAAATRPEIAQAASAVLAQGNAVDAVVAGVLAACALEGTVIFGPVQILVGGAGIGLRAIDGRPRQPGAATTRPRGFKEGEVIPAAARIAVPALPAALAAALVTCGGGSLLRAAAPALDLAKAVPARRALIERIARRGPSVLADDAVSEEILAAAGKIAGGLLTREDLAGVRPVVEPCRETGGAARAPWASEDDSTEGTAVELVAAADGRGVLAIACYEMRAAAVSIEALGVDAPAYADPVLRGTPRTAPGAPRPAACPIALAMTGATAGVFDIALGIASSAAPERALAVLLGRVAAPPPLDLSLPTASAGSALAVLRTREGARALR